MAEGIEKILECPICLEQIKNPKMLPCQHSFCLKNCLENLVEYKIHPVLMCPLCREIYDVPINGVSGFPNNYILQNLLEKQIDTITQNQTKIIRMSNVPEGWVSIYLPTVSRETLKEPAKPASEDDNVPNKVPNKQLSGSASADRKVSKQLTSCLTAISSFFKLPDGQCRKICIYIGIIFLISTIYGTFKALFRYLLS